MRIHFEKLLDECGNNELIPVCLEEETHSGTCHEQNFEKESQQSGNGCGRAHRL